ncbi:hypothetical protein F8568_023555 [Actinomadura sp. LD22]|uniref:Uncharacterized protein n=1 Tax=Actinomadura physcomitrii TaxID=2650748 RepID=A0A6I4MEJ7_9ACTN|nr:hypothetical protein [Actinomadura physcomitrii]
MPLARPSGSISSRAPTSRTRIHALLPFAHTGAVAAVAAATGSSARTTGRTRAFQLYRSIVPSIDPTDMRAPLDHFAQQVWQAFARGIPSLPGTHAQVHIAWPGR